MLLESLRFVSVQKTEFWYLSFVWNYQKMSIKKELKRKAPELEEISVLKKSIVKKILCRKSIT